MDILVGIFIAMVFLATLVGAPMIMLALWKYERDEWKKWTPEQRRRVLPWSFFMVAVLAVEAGVLIVFGFRTFAWMVIAIFVVGGAATWVWALVLGVRGTRHQ